MDAVVNKINCESCGICDTEDTHSKFGHDRITNRSDQMKVSLTTRLNRIEGQVRGIKGMIEKDCYCDDILNQIIAVQAAMKSVGMLLLENHLKSCMVKRIKEGNLDVVDELMITIDRLMK